MPVVNYDQGITDPVWPDATPPEPGGGRQRVTDPPPVGGPIADPKFDAVAEFYKTLLGRPNENAGVVNNWLTGTGGNLDTIRSGIANSAEGKAYAARNTAPPPPPPGSYAGGGDQTILALLQSGMDPRAAAAMFNQTNRRTTGNEAQYYNDHRGQTIGLPSGYASLEPGGWAWTVRTPEGPGGGAGPAAGPAVGSGTPFLASGTNPGGYTDPSSLIYLNQALQRLNQAQQPQDTQVYDLLKSLALKRVTALDAPPYSAADEAALIARYREPLTQARDAAYVRNKETASARGYLPSSGLLQSMDSRVNQGYERAIGQGANEMAVRAIDQKQQNAQQQLQILSSLLSANNQQFDRGSSQADHAVDVAKLFPDFDAQRLDQLLRAGSDNSGSSALNSLTSLGNLNLNASNINNSNDRANSEAWGKLIAGLMAALGGK